VRFALFAVAWVAAYAALTWAAVECIGAGFLA
jgi:hypothetical protein